MVTLFKTSRHFFTIFFKTFCTIFFLGVCLREIKQPTENSDFKQNICKNSGKALYASGSYMFKVNNRNSRTSCKIYSKLIIKIPEQRQCPEISCISNSLQVIFKITLLKVYKNV